ncbi:O-antigen ligase family protein [Nocardioides sp. zg-1308]|uniref:O-antigen ligase family protein n=1 Tax=Nocardioides renjunii TaxID=3095075 RepID=A0ABU5K6P8_9ACTN|nr:MULTISPECIES: O-antigen ligase family protein [unclassified Nocardioides]MDZ5660556.1 O-antigen ligase family protein [Nocardioides sp. S-58]NPD03672.1 O-antigen ligase family protein [Nocardioides sp. zg-1308]
MSGTGTAFVGVEGTDTRRGADATTVLTLYLVLLWLIPSSMVVPALGSAGSPANLLGIAAFFWWVWFHVRRTEVSGVGLQPVRAAMLGWLLIMLMVYANAMAGPIPSDEISVADNGILRLVGMAGILLTANDGISSTERLHALLRRLALAAGAVAVLGFVQYVTHQLWIDRLSIPGLTPGAVVELGARAGFARPSGTSASAIEYGVVLAMALPIMIALASGDHRRRWVFRLLLVPMVLSIYLSVSRSAYLCALVGLMVMALSWTNRQRLQALAIMGVASVAMYLAVPGLLGTILGLFSDADEDPSVSSRTGSYEIASEFVANSPVIGRGFGTFLPKYWILDNGYLGLLIEGGVVGLLGFLAVLTAGILAARRALATTDHDGRLLARAVMASIVAGASCLAFFDTFAFPQTSACVFLVLGIAGAMRRLQAAERTAPGSGSTAEPSPESSPEGSAESAPTSPAPPR